MMRFGKLLSGIAALAVSSLVHGSAVASSFVGEIPVGYSDSHFQIGQGTSYLVININAIGARDSSICAFCNSAYTSNFTVNLFDRAGALLKSVNASNYLYYNMYSSSHGIGAGPVSFLVPGGATTLEIVNHLSVAGLLGGDGSPLGYGKLFISSDGPIAAATPIPASLPLLATGLAALGLLGWYRTRRAPLDAAVSCGGNQPSQAV